MPSNYLILCHPLLLLPSIFPSIKVFSNESVLHIRWPKYWHFSISPSNEYSGLISFRIDCFDLLAIHERVPIFKIIYIHIHMYVYMYTHIYMYMCIYVSYVYICVYPCIYIYAYTHTCICIIPPILFLPLCRLSCPPLCHSSFSIH